MSELTMRELPRRVDRLEARAEVQDRSENRLGILITISGIGFAALIAVIVVVFAVRTEKVAAAAARDEIRASVSSVEMSVEEARVAAAEARKITAELRKVLDAAEADAAALAVKAAPTSLAPEASASLSPEERSRLDRAAAITAGKPLRDMTLPELRIRLAESSQRKSWNEVVDIATAMRLLFQDDNVVAESLNAEGFALHRLGRSNEALEKFDEVVRRYGK